MTKHIKFAKVLDLCAYRATRVQSAIDHAIDISPPPDEAELSLAALLSEYWVSQAQNDADDAESEAPTLRRPVAFHDLVPDTMRSAA
jgi:hypothetical protein